MRSYSFVIIACGVMSLTMAAATTLLLYEYHYFRQQSGKLAQIKEDYQTYIQELKERLDEVGSVDTLLEKKKPKSDECIACFPEGVFIFNSEPVCNDQGVFSQVNRDDSYLKEQALAYAALNNIRSKVAELYDYDAVPVKLTLKKAPQRRGPVRKKATSPVRKKKLRANPYQKPHFAIRWPLDKDKYWLSSFYGPRKKPDGSWGFHHGLDMAALKGTPVYAVANGTVIEVSNSPRGFGKSIVIQHDQKYRTRYAHLDSMLVKVGQKVRVGQLIGKVGATGLVRGKNASHLHLEVMVFGKRINPLYIL